MNPVENAIEVTRIVNAAILRNGREEMQASLLREFPELPQSVELAGLLESNAMKIVSTLTGLDPTEVRARFVTWANSLPQ